MNDYRLNFGRFKGERLENIPDSYLKWLWLDSDFLDRDIFYEVQEEAKRRWAEKIPTRYINPMSFKKNIDSHKIKSIYKKLALEFHPDRSGSTAAMQSLNRFYNDLMEVM